MSVRGLFAIAASFVTFGLSSGARADAIPPEQDACTGKSAGTACEAEGKAGTCVDATCSRLDYSHGTPPRSVDYACVKCDTTGTPPATIDGAAEPVVEASGDTQAAPDTAPTTTGTKAAGSGCAAGDVGAGLGLALALVALGSRRRVG